MSDDTTIKLEDLFPPRGHTPPPQGRRRRSSSSNSSNRPSTKNDRNQSGSADERNVGGPSKKQRSKHKRSRKRIAIITTASVLVLLLVPAGIIGIGIAVFEHSYSSNVHVIADPFPTKASRPAASANGSQNILLLGSDTRGSLGNIASGTGTGERSDTMLLVHIPSNPKDVEVMSIMRDLWVNVPGHGEAKINAAFSWGGVPLVVQTVESLVGVRIDHVAVMDFQGFADMSTALVGVPVNSPISFTSKNMPGYTFDKGTNIVQGQRALAFVRERYAFPDGDYQRVRDQQSFLKGVLTKVTTVNGFPDLGMLNSFVSTTSQYVAVDKGLDFNTLVKLGYQLRDVRSRNVFFFTLPTNGTGTSSDGQSIVLQNPVAEAAISQALKNDSLKNYLSSNGLLGGN